MNIPQSTKLKKWHNPDGTYRPVVDLATHQEAAATKMSDWARKLFTHQITVNSQPRVIIRGKRQRTISPVVQETQNA